jgi:hypothetical protein
MEIARIVATELPLNGCNPFESTTPRVQYVFLSIAYHKGYVSSPLDDLMQAVIFEDYVLHALRTWATGELFG